MTFSVDLTRSVGIDMPRAAKMTDVPCHTWIIPTLLKHSGVNFLHIGCNGASHNVAVPPLFWWEGPDGSRLLTMYSVGYGTGLKPPRSADQALSRGLKRQLAENLSYKTPIGLKIRGLKPGLPGLIRLARRLQASAPRERCRQSSNMNYRFWLLKFIRVW